MHALDQHYAHHMCGDDIPEVEGLKRSFECLNDVDLLVAGPRLRLHLAQDIDIADERELDTIVRKRLGLI